MEHQLWKSIVELLPSLCKFPKPTICDFSDAEIVLVHYWAVIHDRPICWACQPRHWPIHRRRHKLPSKSTMSRRLRSASVRALLDALAARVLAPKEPGLFWMIDGKPLTISGCSTDRHARYGRAAGSMARGYKIHAIVDAAGGIAAWRLAPMNTDERAMAARLLRTVPIQGYVIADANYDSNILHDICTARDSLQLLTRRRGRPGRGLGHRRHSPGRLRSIELTENPRPLFAQQLLRDRDQIERRFAHMTNWGGGLTCLPPWVRTHRRVYRWVQAKLVLTALKRASPIRTCAA